MLSYQERGAISRAAMMAHLGDYTAAEEAREAGLYAGLDCKKPFPTDNDPED
jgi:hypothetical protein